MSEKRSAHRIQDHHLCNPRYKLVLDEIQQLAGPSDDNRRTALNERRIGFDRRRSQVPRPAERIIGLVGRVADRRDHPQPTFVPVG